MADNITTQRMLSESPEVEAYKLNLLQRASELATTPEGQPSFASQLPGYQVAEFQEPQLRAIEAARTMGIGSYMPYIQGANVALGGAYRTAGEAADILRGADTRAQFTDAQTAMQQAGRAAQGMSAGMGRLETAGGLYDLATLRALASDTAARLAPGYRDIQRGIGSLGAAQQMAQQSRQADLFPAVANIGMGVERLTGAAQGYDPSRAQAFMDPYRQQVIDVAMQQIQRQGDIAKQGAAAQAVRSGAFGSTREGVQRAEMERGLLEQKANTMANLLSQGYNQAQANAIATFEQQQQRQMGTGQAQVSAGQGLGQLGISQAQLGQAAAGLMGQMGQQYGALAAQRGALAGQEASIGQNVANLLAQQGMGQQQIAQTMAGIYGQQAGQLQNIGMGIGQLAGQQFGIGQQQAAGLGSLASQLGQLGIQQGALGQTAQAMGQGDINFLYNIGQAQQNLEQQKIDAARATEMQRLYAPYQQAAFLSDIYRGAPSTQMATTAASQPSASPFQQAAGLAIGAGTAYTGAKKLGLFGS